MNHVLILNGMTNRSNSKIIFVQREGMEPVKLIGFNLVAEHIQKKIQINFISFWFRIELCIEDIAQQERCFRSPLFHWRRMKLMRYNIIQLILHFSFVNFYKYQSTHDFELIQWNATFFVILGHFLEYKVAIDVELRI